MADGLPNEWVNAVAVGSDGTVWAGTSAGLARLEGGNWITDTTEEGLPHDQVTAVAVANDGTVWVGTKGGLALLSGSDWVTYTAASIES